MAVEPDNSGGSSSSSSSASNANGKVQSDKDNVIDDLVKSAKAILTSVADTVQFKNELAMVQELLEKNTLLADMIGALQAQQEGPDDENVYLASLHLNELQANLCEIDRLYAEMGLREKK